MDVPGGVESGIAIHMRGEGAEGDAGAPKGDLYVQLEVLPDPYFERSGADLHVTADVKIAQVRCRREKQGGGGGRGLVGVVGGEPCNLRCIGHASWAKVGIYVRGAILIQIVHNI